MLAAGCCYKLLYSLLFLAKIYFAVASSDYLLKVDRPVAFEPPNTTAKYFSNISSNFSFITWLSLDLLAQVMNLPSVASLGAKTL